MHWHTTLVKNILEYLKYKLIGFNDEIVTTKWVNKK